MLYAQQSLSASHACSCNVHWSHHANGAAVQVAHERNSAELHTVCMEVAGDCLPNVVVSRVTAQHALNVLIGVICMQAQAVAASAAFVL